MRRCAAVAMFIGFAARGESELDKSWSNLGHTIKESSYSAAIRDGRCLTGRIDSFDNDSVTIGRRRIERKDVVRIGDGSSLEDHDLIFSGRSSWSDLQRAEPNKYEHIRIDLRNGGSQNCRAFSAKDDQATCDGVQAEKAEVARGYYVRLAQATEWEHHVMRENVPFLAPRTWFNLAFFPRIAVLLYNAASAEESTKIECPIEAPPADVQCTSPGNPNLPKICVQGPQKR